ncbi:hypothetical protein CSDK_0823 [Streptococcus dysgalactiae]
MPVYQRLEHTDISINQASKQDPGNQLTQQEKEVLSLFRELNQQLQGNEKDHKENGRFPN